MKHFLLLNTFIISSLFSLNARGEDYTVDPSKSLFSIVTHKDGIGQSFAHNHLILTKTFNATLAWSETTPSDANSGFQFSFNVNSLVVDDEAEKIRWRPLVDELNLLDEEFGEMSNANRLSVKSSMLGKDQLDAANYPTIEAKASNFRANPLYPANSKFSHLGNLAVTIHGKTVSKVIQLNFVENDSLLEVTATVPYNFTDFDIEPYSAFFGAVKNKNRFDVLVRAVATRQ